MEVVTKEGRIKRWSALRHSHLGLVKINSTKQIKRIRRKNMKKLDALVGKMGATTTV